MSNTAPCQSVFLENMKQLWRKDARLAQRIDELPIEASLTVEPSKSGLMTASVTTPDGRTLFLHSRYDPMREAADFCKGLEAKDPACIILGGLGLGYHLKVLFEHFGEETIILVSEPDPVTIKTALETTDLSQELGSGNVEILTRTDKGSLHERINNHTADLMLGTVFAAPPVAREHHGEFHSDCRRAVTDFAAYAKMSLMTLVRNAGITCQNIANNLPTYVSTPPADVLRRKFSGCPAILVAAGPSLAKNIEQLIDVQDKAVIIAAQTTLRVLLAHGIRPHFVTSLDFSDLSRQFFEALEIPDDLVLVAEPKASWKVIDRFVGGKEDQRRRVILLDNIFARRCLSDRLAKRSPMQAGSTVMHLAFYLAQWLNCDPIIFVGQDLGFSGHCYYSPGVAMHRAWRPELGRFCTLEMKEWERIVRQRRLLRKIKDIHGRPLYTDEQMFTYLEQFERDFARCSARVIDATEGGAKKAGAVVMPLQEALADYCKHTISPTRFDYLRLKWFDPSKWQPAKEALAVRYEQLKDFRLLCEETQSLLDELNGLLDKPKAFNQRIVRIDELRTLVQSQEVIFRMVRDVSQLAELQKFASDRKLSSAAVKGKTRAKRQLQRDRQFVEALLDGCDRLEKIISDSLARFEDALESVKQDGQATCPRETR